MYEYIDELLISDLPSEHGVGLPDSALVGDLHVRPKQQTVNGASDPKVVRLKTHSTTRFNKC